MTDASEPTLRARWLGSKIKELRLAAKRTATDAAEYLGRGQGTISKLESGDFPVQSPDLLKLLDLYNVPDLDRRADLLKLAEDVAQRGWWDGYKPYINSNFADFVWLESHSHAIDQLELTAMPGLTQTEAFATALIGHGPQSGDKLETQRLVEARLVRGRLLTGTSAPHVRFLVHESVLNQQVGGKEVVAGQLKRLIEVAELPNVEVRLLPVTCWAHTAAGINTGFTVFNLRNPFPRVVGVDSSAGAIFDEDPDIDSYITTYDALWQDESVDSQATIKRISSLLKDD